MVCPVGELESDGGTLYKISYLFMFIIYKNLLYMIYYTILLQAISPPT